MIDINLVQNTAEVLMKKAAIEIPDDYLSGLKVAAAAEDGDLSSFVLEAMLENYEAAKEDSRAMCGDTGCRFARTAFIRCGEQIMTTMSALAHRKSNMDLSRVAIGWI